ncbi:MAG TPA: ThiF family adenylyltransferase [Actinomycetes bacterium]|nr:ThiF family adenylyltransferase [Actinomycetes bacterium]
MQPVRPQLKPALRKVWRDGTTLQLGLDPSRAVVIGGLDPRSARLVDALDGTCDIPGLKATAARLGVTPRAVEDLLVLLARSGVLEDAAADHRVLASLPRAERDRLGPDLAAASILHAGADSGVGVVSRRRGRVVAVHGAGRVGAPLVALLAAAGVGTLVVEDAGVTTPADLSPAGLGPDDTGARRQDAAARAVRRIAPSVRTRPPPARGARDATDLVVITGEPAANDRRTVDRLVRAGVPHLVARVRDTTGLVGPLVLPGRSSCLRCHDLHRADRDPAWPAVAAQLSAAGRHRVSACDVMLATAVAAHAGLQVLAFLDGDTGSGVPSTVDGTLEIAQLDGRVRRRSWTTHPACGCTWPRAEPEL